MAVLRDKKGKFVDGNNIRKTHGMCKTKTYLSWKNMIQRCENVSNPAYNNYGGRGIKICERWKKFENFLSDMGLAPIGMTLDRIDCNKGYSTDNCRWSTMEEQQNNRRNNRRINFNGKTLTLTRWALLLKIKRSTLAQRLYVYKWPIEKVLTV